MTKINCPKLSKVTSNILDFHGFRKRERDRERVISLKNNFAQIIYGINRESYDKSYVRR